MVVGGGWDRVWLGGGTALGEVGEAEDGPPTVYGEIFEGGTPKGLASDGGWPREAWVAECWIIDDGWIGRLDERAPARELALGQFGWW